MNKENPAAAGAVLDEDHTLIPSDNIRINNNFQKAWSVQIIASLSLIDNKIKTLDRKHFSSNGKLKSGERSFPQVLALKINWEKLPSYTRK